MNLGAGLDTRPYRMELPADLEWIEVDYSAVLDYKAGLLTDVRPRCRLTRTPVDLADSAAWTAFLATLDAPGRRILALTEGVVPYLANEQVAELGADLRRVAAVSGWIVDYLSESSHRYREKGGIGSHMRNAPFKFRPDDWFGFFRGLGWRVREIRYLPIEGARLGRPAPLPLLARLIMAVTRRLAPADRAAAFSRFTGYAILE